MAGVRKVKAGWYNAFRPWTLHGAVVPVLIGAAIAYSEHTFDTIDWVMFALVMAGGILLQSAANLLNTYGDFKNGYDTEENHSRSPELVTGVLRPKRVFYAGLVCLGVTALIGL
ncbi:MAG: prenyltransferase, partial [Candidatus Methanomethylophilaceae archaeon]|nr:prenyltransferase [Candidatus Methanomethylophilaceae archaeon]